MKWTKVDNYYFLKEFPFFVTCISESYDKRKYYYRDNTFENLDIAKRFVIDTFLKLKIDEIQFPLYWPIIANIITSGWPNNIGEGRYIKPYINDEQYIWVEGMHQPWRSPCVNYAIRFDFNTNHEYVEKWLRKILNRQLNRFKREFSNGKN